MDNRELEFETIEFTEDRIVGLHDVNSFMFANAGKVSVSFQWERNKPYILSPDLSINIDAGVGRSFKSGNYSVVFHRLKVVRINGVIQYPDAYTPADLLGYRTDLFPSDPINVEVVKNAIEYNFRYGDRFLRLVYTYYSA